MRRGHLHPLGGLERGWTGAAAMRAPEVCGVVIMTGAVQAPEGQGHGWAWVGWDVVTCLVHRRVNGMGVLAEY